MERHGTAALTTQAWLGEEPVEVDGLPYRWRASHGRAVSVGSDEVISLAPGEQHLAGDLLLRAVERAGVVALRVFDPRAPRRAALVGIDAFAPDPAWIVDATFVPAQESSIRIERFDGVSVDDALAGSVRFRLAEHDVALVAFPGGEGGSWITFGDQTNGTTTKQFRFLTLPAPGADGRVEIDFNRAHLPPCAFSEHYLCPLPPPDNRLRFPVEAGETYPILR